MKYLKKFFESSELSDANDLQDFCEMYLAYLTDEDWEVEISVEPGFRKTFRITINNSPTNITGWDQIKDKIIPFLEMLKKNYNFGVYPEQSSKFHKSWLDKCILISLAGNSKSNSINIDELIEDKPTYGYPRPGKYLKDITSMEIVVHTKDLNESECMSYTYEKFMRVVDKL